MSEQGAMLQERRRFLGLQTRFADPVMIALLAVTISMIGAANPSYWYDEAATISATNRSLPELARLLTTVDAVHALYYLLMHGWFSVFPRTEFWARVPSCLAIGLAAAGVVVLTKLLSTRRVAVTAGIVFAVLPRITWAGMEARPYAMTCVVSVWLTVVLIVGIRRGGASVWVLYGSMLFLSGLFNVYVLLMVLVHLFVLLFLRVALSTLGAWVGATGLATGLLLPFCALVRSQSGQVGWIEPLDYRTLGHVFGTQYFDRSIPFALLAASMMVLAVIRSSRHRKSVSVDGMRTTIAISIAWMVLPTSVVLVYSAVVGSVYADRYLSFTAPAMAMLLAACVIAITRSPVRITATLVLFTVAAAPNFVAQRSDYAKVKMDYSQVADLVAAQSSAGDCLLLDDTVSWRPGPIRPLVAARRDAYANLVDVGLGESAVTADALWDTNIPPYLVSDRIARCQVIWTISEKDSALPAHEMGVALPPGLRFGESNAFWVPADLGFRLVERWQFNLAQVTKAVR